MVHRRGSKFGVVTSRTLRKTEYFTKPREFYNGQFIVTKYVEQGRGQHFTINKEFQEILQDGLEVYGYTPISTSDMPDYSLNKRKRWQLPRLLREAILDGDLEDLPFRVSLIERAPRARLDPNREGIEFYGGNQPDCLSVTRSKCPKREFKPKAKYSFETDLLGDRKRRWGIITHSVKEDDPGDSHLPELTYEVCYPRHKTTYPSFTPLSRARVQMCEWYERAVKAKRKEKLHREKLYPGDDERNMTVQECEVFLDDREWAIDDAELEEVQPPLPNKTNSSCLGDFISLHSKRKTSRRKKRKRTARSSAEGGQSLFPGSSKKNCAILDPTIKLEEEEEEEESTDLSASASSLDSGFSDASDTMFTFDPIDYTTVWQDVTLERSSLEESSMARTFGDSLLDYAESDPYCAAINLCRVDEDVSRATRFDEVVLLIQRRSGDSSTTHCRFRVCDLRGDKCSGHFADTSTVSIDGQQVYSVSEFVEIVKQSLESYLRPNENRKVKCRKPKRIIRLDTVSSILGWQYNSKAEDAVLEDMIHQEEISSARSFNSYQPCTPPPPETCEICFDDIVETEGSIPSATALRQCSHWFCGACWQQHVTSRTQQGDANIRCPAFECDTPVDTTTQLALLPDPFLPLYSRLRRSRILNRQKTWEWCQNPLCSRMVSVEGSKQSPHNGDDQKNVIHCECGYSWCHGCKEEVHWPATCQQAAEYKDYVENKGVDAGEDRITAVEVKHCPQCSYPIEKDGGCMHMECCFCNYEYCWECLSSWMSHMDDWQGCDQQPTVSVSLDKNKKGSSAKMYLLAAAERRKERISADKVKTSAERIGLRLYYQYLKSTNKHLPQTKPCVISAFKKSYSLTWISSDEGMRQLEGLLRLCESANSLFIEISFILEYLNVLIATGKTKQLRLRNSGWKDTIDKLGFISLRLRYILTGEGNLKYPEFSASLQRLMQTGRQRLKEVIGALPRVYKLLATKDIKRRRLPVAVPS